MMVARAAILRSVAMVPIPTKSPRAPSSWNGWAACPGISSQGLLLQGADLMDIFTLVKVIEAQEGKGDLHYLDYLGWTVPW
jgi:hypothetical protein